MSRKKFLNKELEPDEIFLDSKNLPGFERERFEGRLEFPISASVFWYLGLAFLVTFGIFFYRLYDLQILEGPVLKARADANHLKIIPLWPERGRILDRDGKVLADNNSVFRLVLDASELDLDVSSPKVEEFLEVIQSRLILPSLPQEIWTDISLKKDGIVAADFSDWQTLEDLRKSYPILPLRLEAFSSRVYLEGEAFSHLIGYLSYLSLEEARNVVFFETNKLVGRSGIEEVYEEYLSGKVGSKLTEVDSKGETFSEVIERLPQSGEDIYLSIAAQLQKRVWSDVKNLVDGRGFKGGAAVLMDIQTGEILSLVSYPGFDPNLLTRGSPREDIESVLSSSAKPLFNRAISGLYSSGSIIKPLLALAALEEKVITPEKEILSMGSLILPNPFNPEEPSIFYDWKAHGWVDMRHAIAVSSNVYFFTVGGGFGDIQGLGISRIQKWLQKFGFGEKTSIDLGGEKEGFVPSPEWKARTQKEDPSWRIGDTYNLSIGQGNFQVTPLQMAIFSASLANGGEILEPYLVKEVRDGEEIIYKNKKNIRKIAAVSEENLRVIQEGMKMASEFGTAQALSGLNVNVAAKTGTAEIGSGKNVNSWFIGYLPYEKPKIAMAIVLESGNASNLVGATAAARQIIEWILIYRPELLDTSNN